MAVLWDKELCLQVPTVIFFTDSELGRAGRRSSQVGTKTILFVIGWYFLSREVHVEEAVLQSHFWSAIFLDRILRPILHSEARTRYIHCTLFIYLTSTATMEGGTQLFEGLHLTGSNMRFCRESSKCCDCAFLLGEIINCTLWIILGFGSNVPPSNKESDWNVPL